MVLSNLSNNFQQIKVVTNKIVLVKDVKIASEEKDLVKNI